MKSKSQSFGKWCLDLTVLLAVAAILAVVALASLQ